MEYIDNPFEIGNYALCINENFPVVETTGDKSQIGKQPLSHPKYGEICCVDEVLGEYFRFDEHDCDDPNNPDYGWKWWKHTHFKILTQEEVEEHYANAGKDVKQWFDNIVNNPTPEFANKSITK